MKNLDVCLSTNLIQLYDLSDKVVVIVDILRATSCIITGFAHGVENMKTFSSLEKCKEIKSKGYIIAGERNGEKVNGFDLGNSPFDYMKKDLKGKKIALTTTNGTQAIEKSKNAKEIIIGSFLNFSSVTNYLKNQSSDVIIFCAGWKGKICLEDTLFAGALVEALTNEFSYYTDAPIIAKTTFQSMKNNMIKELEKASHAQRLNKLNLIMDIAFCLKKDEYNVLPTLVNDTLINQ